MSVTLDERVLELTFPTNSLFSYTHALRDSITYDLGLRVCPHFPPNMSQASMPIYRESSFAIMIGSEFRLECTSLHLEKAHGCESQQVGGNRHVTLRVSEFWRFLTVYGGKGTCWKTCEAVSNSATGLATIVSRPVLSFAKTHPCLIAELETIISATMGPLLPCPLHIANALHISTSPPLKFLTWNVRGIQSRLSNIQPLLQANRPDVCILTETKLRHHQRSWLCTSMSNYSPIFSSSPSSAGSGKAGVLIALHRRFNQPHCHRSHM